MSDQAAEFDPFSVDPVQIIQAFIQATVHDRDQEAVKKLVTKASAEQGSFSPPGDANEMNIEIGQPELDGQEWVVPVTIINPKDASQPPFRTPFTIRVEEGEWKIDMLRTMERMFGGSMDAVMDGMVDALKGVGEAMAQGMQQAFEGIGDALGGALGSSPPLVEGYFDIIPSDSSPAMVDVINAFNEIELPDQVNLMREAIGNELTFHVDWHSFNGDVEAAKKVARRVLHTVRSAVCLSSSDDKMRDLLRRHLLQVTVAHVGYPEGRHLAMASGRLQITTNLNDVGPGAGHHSSDEIIKAMREALDADRGPAIDHLMVEVIPQIKEELREHLDLDIDIDIDLASITDGHDTDTILRVLRGLENDVFRNLVYHLREANQKDPLAGQLSGLRFEHVPSIVERAMFVRGSKIIFRLCFTEDGGTARQGYYGANELDHLLPALAASLPDYSSPGARNDGGSVDADSAEPADVFDFIAQYRDIDLPELTGNLQAAIGKGLDIEIDWAGVGDELFDARQLRLWGVNRLVGAFRFIARDTQGQLDLNESVSYIRWFFVRSIEEKSIDLEQGVLTISLCLSEAEAGCFHERALADRIISMMGTQWKPVVARIRESAEYWEAQLAQDYAAPVRYFIDFAGVTSAADDGRVGFGLSLLREHGVDVLYHAVTGLLKSNPNFAEQFRQRVRRFVVNHVGEPSQKGVGFEQDAIVYQLFLHEGYKGYLTLADMKKALPGIVAQMRDVPAQTGEEDEPLTEYEQDEMDRLARKKEAELRGDDGDDESDEAGDAVDADASHDGFEDFKASIESSLPSISQSFAVALDRAIPLTINWESIGRDQMAAGLLLNACLSPIVGGLFALAQDGDYRDDLIRLIDRIELARAASLEEQSIRLEGGTLSVAVFVTMESPDTLSQEDAIAIIKGLVDYVRANIDEPAGEEQEEQEEQEEEEEEEQPVELHELTERKQPTTKASVKKVASKKPTAESKKPATKAAGKKDSPIKQAVAKKAAAKKAEGKKAEPTKAEAKKSAEKPQPVKAAPATTKTTKSAAKPPAKKADGKGKGKGGGK